MADRYPHVTGTAPGRFLSSPPRLAPAVVRGALASPGRARRLRRPGWTGRIRDDAGALPKTRLVLAGARIDPGRLASYARICGFPSDRNGTVPLTYPHVLGFPLAMRLMTSCQFPLPVLGLVHTWIEIGGERALSADERPEISVYARSLVPHRRGVEVIIVTEARVGGEVVWHSRSAYLARHRDGDGQGDGLGRAAVAVTAVAVTAARRPRSRPTSPDRCRSARSGGYPPSWAVAMEPCPATATPSTCIRSPRGPSASRARSPMACGRSPAVSRRRRHKPELVRAQARAQAQARVATHPPYARSSGRPYCFPPP
ncbi:acyl dehydratase [Streptomyces sp. L-9-10]|nr:acyl dehydratase [Streptomyces sp. L-9-10]